VNRIANAVTDAVARTNLMFQTPDLLEAAMGRGEPTWTTQQLRDDFEVIGFLGPYVAVKRRSDGVAGSLLFTHSPRVYFGWMPDDNA